jgi:hypothetical protein
MPSWGKRLAWSTSKFDPWMLEKQTFKLLLPIEVN